MRRLAVVDGVVVAPQDARVSVYDRGFLYGHAVFEVTRTYEGRPFALREHLARLRSSSSKVGIDLPWSADELAAEVLSAVDAARAGSSSSQAGDEAYLRLTVTAGEGLGMSSPVSAPRRVLLVEPLGPEKTLADLALDVALVRAPRDADVTAARDGAPGTAKVTGYLATILALADARRAGAGDVIYVDGDGDDAVLREGGTSNVFLVHEGASGAPRLTTPPLEGCILPGITRSHLLAVARHAGFETEERVLSVADLRTANEAFLTSSVREIAPIMAVRGLGPAGRTLVGSGDPGPRTEQLLALFRAHARAFG